jgi:nitroreductase
MPQANPDALDFLLTRRSRPAKSLTGPAPDRDTLLQLLTAAARSPDHGKLEPWRFLVLERPALLRLSAAVAEAGARLGKSSEDVAKQEKQYADGQLAVAVVFCPKPSEKIPEVEQLLSAGAVCLQLLNAALASGWGANWLTGWTSHDRGFLEDALGLEAGESLAGYIFLGTETAAPPERPRPDVAAITTWVPE